MANIKSAKKRILVAEKNRLRNVAFKSSIKTAVRKVLELANAGQQEELKTADANITSQDHVFDEVIYSELKTTNE